MTVAGISTGEFVECNCCGLDNPLTQIVVSRGNPSARLMIIGEAPGAREDALGEPFVGRSGRLLDQLLEEFLEKLLELIEL